LFCTMIAMTTLNALEIIADISPVLREAHER
jgi:hypothetical protein